MKMTTSKTFACFSSSSHRHRFDDDEKKFNTKRRLSFFKRIEKRNIIETSSSLRVNGFNDNREGFSNEKYSEDVERKYNFYDNARNKNDDYETKNKRNDFYRMKPSDDFDENNTNNNNNSASEANAKEQLVDVKLTSTNANSASGCAKSSGRWCSTKGAPRASRIR